MVIISMIGVISSQAPKGLQPMEKVQRSDGRAVVERDLIAYGTILPPRKGSGWTNTRNCGDGSVLAWVCSQWCRSEGNGNMSLRWGLFLKNLNSGKPTLLRK